MKWTVYLLIVLFAAWSYWEIRITPGRLLVGLEQSSQLMANAWPPDFTPERREMIWRDILETLAMAVIATIGGIILSVPVAILGSRNLVSERVFWIGRTIIATSRAFHALIIAIIVVKAVGFGPLAGIITLMIKTVGFFGKLLAEEIEDIDPTQLEAIEATGAGRFQTYFYAVVPQITQRFVALSIYRWDINLRSSAIVGIVGAGGIGQTLVASFDRFEYDFSAAIILVIIALVLLGEAVSAVARKRISTGAAGVETTPTRDAGRRTWNRFTRGQQLLRYGSVALVAGVIVISWRHLEMGIGVVRTAPAELYDLWTRMWPPSTGIVAEMVDPLLTSLHIAILGTVLAIALSIPTALIAADTTTPNRVTYTLGKLIVTTTRSVNVIIWVLVLVLLLGPGALAGVVAIGIRSVGFIGKLLAEAIEEIDMTQVEAMTATGASRLETAVYAIVPQVKPAFIGIATYRWDSNVRASTVIGFVGGGGIGSLLMSQINQFQWANAMTILIAILGIVLFSEVVSAYARKKVM
nr:phosphonate ABC transporter, permease protein PhnE [Natronorubrum sulfidifaciens]